MTPRIILDPSGENPISEQYQPVKTDVEFLCFDTSGQHLWIAGERLCQWALSLFKARHMIPKIDYAVRKAPRERIRLLADSAADVLSIEVVLRAINVIEQNEDEVSLASLLKQMTKQDVWLGSPSPHHAAQWLMTEISEELTPLAEAQAQCWSRQCEEPLSQIYRIPVSERDTLIRQWLGINCDEAVSKQLGAFPLELSEPFISEYRSYWGKQLRKTQGAAISSLPTESPNVKQIAEVAYNYFRDNPQKLTAERLARIRYYLRETQRVALDVRVQPPFPKTLTGDAADEVIRWATDEYLPYRRWQVLFALQAEGVSERGEVVHEVTTERSEQEQERTIRQLAASFSEWVLEQYPRLTNVDREIISINLRAHWLVSQLIKQQRVLWVVVDGLNFINHRRLLELLAQTEAELRLETEAANLAVIPTVTDMAKWALVTGQFPSENNEQNWNINRAFIKTFPNSAYAGSENIAHLKEQLNSKNNLFFWNVMTLDNHYHRQTDPNAIAHQIESDLNSLAKNISDVVMEAPDSNELAVVISSDHGQLLGPSPPIAIELANTKAHGRLAYGALFHAQGLAENSYRQEDNLVVLNPVAFRLPHPITLALDDGHFKGSWLTDSNGKAWGVHGGLYPEEMVVGIAVLSRQVQRQPVTASVSGTGDAGKPCNIEITIDNPNRVELKNILLALSNIPEIADGVFLSGVVHAQEQKVLTCSIQNLPQPTEGDNLPVKGRLEFTYADGTNGISEFSGNLTSKTLYTITRPSLRGRF